MQINKKARKYGIVLLILFATCSAYCNTYYVATTGSDSNPGTTIDYPFLTIPKAVTMVVAGDTIYVRGGTYTYTTTISLSASGTSGAKYYLFAYNNEKPILDFSGMADDDNNRGIILTGSYWYIKGLNIYKAGDNGMIIQGNYNRIELCTFYENRDSGLQLDNGAAYNDIINCDSYYNLDSTQGNSDGFSPKLTVGTGNYFYGCRAWQNSDDGYDGYLKSTTQYPDDMTTTLENCWAFKSGYLKSGAVATSGNGNGFKMGGSNLKDFRHNFILKNCLSFQNKAKGFDQNSNKGSMTLRNCTAFNNGGNNFYISLALASGKTCEITNCLYLTGTNSIAGFVVQTTNGWMSGFTTTSADFTSIDPSAAYGPRNADGSLPDISFMRLALGSDLIDTGTNVGLPYNGSAPDIGAFEYLPGDCHSDGQIDLLDLKCVADNWLTSSCGTCNGADFSGDHTVNFYDFAIMAEYWMQ